MERRGGGTTAAVWRRPGDGTADRVWEPIGRRTVNDLPPPRNRSWSRSGREQFGDAKGQVKRLARVEPGITGRRVPLMQLAFDDVLDPAEALGHVVAGQLHMDATGPGPHLAVGRKKP